ncbi:hypothetical protein [Microbulbifer sp. JMSA008]|uniref:hypothetical protein n=1 Tax=Microbulbifer sp. JMSA008 TaxID=3243373 RepID=UPI004039ED7A
MNNERKVREIILIFSTALALVPAWVVGLVGFEVDIFFRAVFISFALILGLKVYDILGVYEFKKRSMKYGFIFSAAISIILYQFLRDGFGGLTGREWFVVVSFFPLIVVLLIERMVSQGG